MVLASSLLYACSLGTEVGNGNRPKPSEEPTNRNPQSDSSNESQPQNDNTVDTKSPTSAPVTSPPPSSPVNGGGAPSTASPSNATVQTGNPADANCLAKGGRLEAKKDARGNAYSLCHLPNGVTCESWAFFRGECPK
jgi:putative hemolysin